MNWKTVALSALSWKMLALGLVAGLWSSLLYESALTLPGIASVMPWRAPIAGAALGLGLGLWLAPADALLRHYFRRALKAAFAGAVLGAALGAVGAALQTSLLRASGSLTAAWPWATPAVASWAGLAAMLGLIGGGIGLAAGLVAVQRRRALLGGLKGLIAGTLLAVPLVAAVQALHYDPWVVMGALAGWGALLSLVLHWWEKRRARRWLRLLTAPGEDDLFPLDGARITLGKHERNDIPLPRFHEIYPYHCELRWSGDHYDVVDNEQGGVVLVNFRQVQEHPLKPGDLMKVGSALLQYGEAS